MTNAIALDPAVAHAISPRGRHLLDTVNANLKTWDKVRTREDQTGKEVAAIVVAWVYEAVDDGRDPVAVLEQCAMQLQEQIDSARADRAERRRDWYEWAKSEECFGVLCGIGGFVLLLGIFFALPLVAWLTSG